MKRTLALASSLAVVALAGCSSQIDRKTASGSYEYLKTEETKKRRRDGGGDPASKLSR